ncbi:Thiol:disulfide interchange protein DsbA [Candidatus Ecksteinia adelgidicola]|nr:Thiol:disulfide interchange protein DsbA [Candidatus Ecksteinia adelgidicola]
MKKIWLTIILSIVISYNALATNFRNDTHYITLNKPLSLDPVILESFSFYCSYCFEFDQVYHIIKKIKKSLPVNTTVIKYHVDFIGPLGKSLSHAWALAMALGIEDKINVLIFQAIQTKNIHTKNDIRNIFIKAGISAKNYDAAWNSFLVKSLVIKQKKILKNLLLLNVPTICVNNKYVIINNALDTSSIKSYTNQLINLVRFLVQLDK